MSLDFVLCWSCQAKMGPEWTACCNESHFENKSRWTIYIKWAGYNELMERTCCLLLLFFFFHEKFMSIALQKGRLTAKIRCFFFFFFFFFFLCFFFAQSATALVVRSQNRIDKQYRPRSDCVLQRLILVFTVCQYLHVPILGKIW